MGPTWHNPPPTRGSTHLGDLCPVGQGSGTGDTAGRPRGSSHRGGWPALAAAGCWAEEPTRPWPCWEGEEERESQQPGRWDCGPQTATQGPENWGSYCKGLPRPQCWQGPGQSCASASRREPFKPGLDITQRSAEWTSYCKAKKLLTAPAQSPP